jgi:glycosyltransferase involved in cell wall biosynthesis
MVAATGMNGPKREKTMAERIPLSVAIITKNEAANLPGCLESVRFAEQVVVVDSGSADGTLDIARRFGRDVFVEPWRGFGSQKQYAIDKCSHPWVLLLDADERVPPATESVIREIVASAPGAIAGYSFPRKNYFQGRWIRHLWGGDRVVRLFQKNCGRMTASRVHEAVEVDGPVKALQVPLEHHTESSLSKLLIKIDLYSTLGAQDAFEQGRKASVWLAAFLALFVFTQSYFLKLGFLDGRQGLVLSVIDSVNKFFKYAKLSELNRQKDGSEEERK